MKKSILVALTLIATQANATNDEFTENVVGNVAWTAAYQQKMHSLPALKEKDAAQLVFINTGKQDQVPVNLYVNDHYLTALKSDYYTNAVVCAGDVAIRGNVGNANNISLNHQLFSIQRDKTYYIDVQSLQNGKVELKLLSPNAVEKFLNNDKHQAHQISRLNEQLCDVRVSVKFSFDNSEINDSYITQMARLAHYLNYHPESKILIAGYTDSIGTEKYNQSLSIRRAQRIKAYLVKTFKVNTKQIKIQGFGEKNPKFSNATANGRAKNRRVQVFFIHI